MEDNLNYFLSFIKKTKHGLSSHHCSPSPFLKEEFGSCSLSATAMFAKWKNTAGEETVYPQCYWTPKVQVPLEEKLFLHKKDN